ncbi:hypothetical protein JXA85_03930 [Candidatus Woesearchaeota archaeon]|nr:hypothetical protein [Candidatus Woesearchaeota archaeon]
MALVALENGFGATIKSNVSDNQAGFTIAILQENITSIGEQGFDVARFEDSINDMRSLKDAGENDKVMEKYYETVSLIRKMFYLNDLIEKDKVLIEEAERQGLNTTMALLYYNLGSNEFRNGNFESAEASLAKSDSAVIGLLSGKSGKAIERLKSIPQQVNDEELVKLLEKLVNETLLAEKNKDFSRLFITTASIEEINHSVISLEHLKSSIENLELAGYKTKRLRDSFAGMIELFRERKYDEVIIMYNSTVAIMEKIRYIENETASLTEETRRQEYNGIDFSEAEHYINSSLREFSFENYEKSEEYLVKAKSLASKIEQKHLFTSMLNRAKMRLNIVEFLKKNWWKIIVLLVIASAVAVTTYNLLLLKSLERNLENLRKEQHTITEMTKTLQLDYFKHKTIDNETYKEGYSDFDRRMSRIKEEIPLTEEKKKKIEERIKNFRKIFRKKAMLFILLAIFLAQLAYSDSPPVPHGISGFIIKNASREQVPLGTTFSVNDTLSRDYIWGKTSVPVPGNSGKYSVVVNGNDGDLVIVRAWNSTHYGETNATVYGDIDGVNVTLNRTRKSETNLTIIVPQNNSIFNITRTINLTAMVSILGTAGTDCNATLLISNDSVLNLSTGFSYTAMLGSIAIGEIKYAHWNLTALWLGNSNITVTSRCGSDGDNLEKLSYKTTTNITIKDQSAPVIIIVEPDNNSIFSNNTVLFRFNVTDNETGIKNCSLTINRTLDQVIYAVNQTMTQNFTKNFTRGSYVWKITCYNDDDVAGSSENRYLKILDPDFAVYSWNILFSNDNPQENRTIQINATILNTGDENGTNVRIQFYERDPDADGFLIWGNFTVNITGETNITLSIEYNTTVSSHDIYVVVDPPFLLNGSITELNETNNKAYRTLNIPIWQIYYGDIFKNIILGMDIDSSLMRWLNDSNLNGNIYVIDTDSSISWVNLTALSRNISGNLRIDDFHEMDVALNYSGLYGSVNTTFTSNEQTKNTTSYNVYNRTIADVPNANSTNNSNFLTGILWDANDLNNGEYNGSQDVVFLTKINSQLVEGAYGSYNYEIRVPANLKKYKTPNVYDTITFYTELS